MTKTRDRSPMLTLRALVIIGTSLLPAAGAGGVAFVSIPPSPLAPLIAICVGLGGWLGAAAALDQMVE